MKLKSKRRTEQETERWPTLDEIIDMIEQDDTTREVTDAINRSNIYAEQGLFGIVNDILLARNAHIYAAELGLNIEIEVEEQRDEGGE